MFQRDEVLPLSIMDGSKEQTMANFAWKQGRLIVRLNKLSHILHGRMQQSLWSERPSVQLVKDGCVQMPVTDMGSLHWTGGNDLVARSVGFIWAARSSSWDYCVWADSRYITVHWIWFDLIIYYDQIAFPDPKKQLGQWLGPVIDLGPATTAKILKANGQVEYNSTHCSLTNAELDNPIQIAAQDAFMTQLNSVIGPPVEREDLALIHADVPTSEHELYEEASILLVGSTCDQEAWTDYFCCE
jgi:hypothetical protein